MSPAPNTSASPRNEPSSPTLLGDITGRVEGHRDGHGFVVPPTGDASIWIAPQEMHAVLHRDLVRVRIVRVDRKGRPEGRVLEILERHKAPIIGRLLHEGGHWIVAPEDKRYGQDILIHKNGIANAQPGQVVAVELTEAPSLHAQPVGRVTEVLGGIDDPGLEIEIAVRKYEVPHRFSAAAQAQAAALPDKLRAADRRHRVDLSDVPLVTIDGEDARDFDDAVYCEPWQPEPVPGAAPKKRVKKAAAAEDAAPAGWRLLVAIADVSHYVKPGEALDDDAYERATSVYFPRRVIPMLPEKLSNGLCSLNPDVDRLCMVCDMLVTADGTLHAYQFYPAVMHSHARFTYTEVAAILANTRGPEAARREARVPQLLHLHEVYRALLKARGRRGAMDFETTETQIVCDDTGRIEKIVPRTRNEAHRLIEEAMLAANVCSAQFIASHEHPGLFRVHEGPTPEKRVTLQNYLRALGLGLSISDDPAPAEFAAIAAATQGRPDAQQIHTMLLRSMQQAIYTPVNSGHFGLAYEAYTHFTSPIRRYPDLLVHRVIKALLAKRRYHHLLHPGTREPDPRQRKRLPPLPRAHGKPPSEELLAWEATGAHCSANERRADEASRDVEAWLKCAYMREKLGEEYGGTVTSVAGFGLFVTLDALYVEGLVHITELGGEYYKFDEVRQELRGERTGVRYAIGTRVRVQVSRVDLDGRKIDFRMVREGAGERLIERGRGERKTAGAAETAAPTAQGELVKIKALDRQRKAQARERKAQAGERKPSGRGAAGKAPRSAAVGKRVARGAKKKA